MDTTYLMGEYTNTDNGEILDLLGDEPGQPGMVRVRFFDGEDVMPRATLEFDYELTPFTARDYDEMAEEASDLGENASRWVYELRARRAA